MPAIIFSHGFDGNHSNFGHYADTFAKMGYVIYRFDFCGGSDNSKSDGKTTDMSIFTERTDLEAVIKTVRELPYVDKNNITLIGASQGGAVSAITASKNSDKINGMVLLFPGFVIPDDAIGEFGDLKNVPDTYSKWGVTLGRTFAQGLFDYDIYEDIKGFYKDVLIIHGDCDEIVPISYSRKALKVYPSAQLKVIKGGGHGFFGANNETAINYIKEYLSTH